MPFGTLNEVTEIMTTANTTLEALARKIHRYAFDSDSNVAVYVEGSGILAIEVYGVKLGTIVAKYASFGEAFSWELDSDNELGRPIHTTVPPSGFTRIFNRIAEK